MISALTLKRMSKVKAKLLFLLLSVFSVNSYALVCPVLKVEDIAKYVIDVELSGVQIEELSESSCMDQNRNNAMLLVGYYSNEEPIEVYGVVQDKSTIKILSVTELDQDVYSYKVKFQVDAIRKSNNKKETVIDEATFFIYKTYETQKEFGCAGVTEHPKKVLVYEECFKK